MIQRLPVNTRAGFVNYIWIFKQIAMKTHVSNKGFTAAEVLITLAIFGVMLSMAAPPLTQFLDDVQARQNTNDLLSSLMVARSEAITRNTLVTLCKIDTAAPLVCDNGNDWHDGWIAFADEDADGVRDAGEEIVTTHTGMKATTFVSATANFTDTVSYRPSGAVINSGAFNICVSGSTANNVIVNATGRPRVADAVCP